MGSDFPIRLRLLRERQRMNRKALGECCGLSKNMIGMYENGKNDYPLVGTGWTASERGWHHEVGEQEKTEACSGKHIFSVLSIDNSNSKIQYVPKYTGANRRFDGAKYAAASSSVASRTK